MDWIFKGLETPIPIWFIIVLLIAGIALTVWSYLPLNIRKSHKITLIALRSIAFILLAITLINPVVQRVGVEVIKHRVPVLFDISQSTGLSLGSYQGDTSYAQSRLFLDNVDTSKVQLIPFGFDRAIDRLHLDSISLDGRETDLALALGTTSELERDAKAIILFTDGQFNAGRDPRFVVDRMSNPLYIIGLGDSTRMRDLLIQDAIHPDIAYKDTRIPIEIMVGNDGFTGRTTTVTLRSGSQTIDSKQVTFRSDRSVQPVTFEIDATDEGLRQFEAIVQPVDGEWTTRNNAITFSIDVLDNRLRVLMLSFEVHPDVRVMQSILDSDESIFTRTLTWLNGERFLGGALPIDADTLDLIILHGFPHASIPAQVVDKVTTLMTQTSYILTASPLFDPALAMRRLEGSIPLALPPVNSPFEIGLIVNQAAREHPILSFEQPDYERAPRLFGHIRSLRAAPGSEVLLKASFRNADVDAPVLVVRTVGSRRTAVLNMFNFYTWSQSSNPLQRNAIQDLIRNTIVWTSTQPDDRRLVINPTRRSFDSADPVLLNGFLKDESGIQVSDGMVDLQLSREDGEISTYTFQNDGLGKYSLDLGALPQGLYSYEATAMRGSREIDRRNGQFSVSENGVEFTNTRRNDALLQDLAGSTGGQYVSWENANELTAILNGSLFSSMEEQIVAVDWYMYRRIGWFLLALVLLTSEWLLRKYVALP